MVAPADDRDVQQPEGLPAPDPADVRLYVPDPEGWMIRIKLAPGATLDHLMDKAKYDEQAASEGH